MKKVIKRNLKRYPDDYDPITEYWNSFPQNGGDGFEVSDRVYRTYKKIIDDMNNRVLAYYYSPLRAKHFVEFAENFTRHSKGRLGGQLVQLELWEKAMFATIFGFIDMDGNRWYSRAVLIIAKKNGKSLIASIAALYMLVFDGEAGPEVYSVATKKDQAKIIWKESASMVRKSPELLKRVKPKVNELDSTAYNDGVFKPLASDSDSLDGLNISFVSMDEIHQWKNGRPLYDIMADGTQNRDQPLIFITSTAGTVREDIFDEIYDEARQTIDGYSQGDGYKDDHSIFFIYELDKKEEWTDETKWYKANPGLGTIKNKKSLEERVKQALQDPKKVKNLLTKDFNIRETSVDSWLNFNELVNEDTFDIAELKPRYGIGGVDLSRTTDLTAAVILFKVPGDETIYAKSMFWLPGDRIAERSAEDKVPYDKWYDKGLLRASGTDKIDYKDVVNWFTEVQQQDDIYLFDIGYDSWSATYFIDELQANFGASNVTAVIQGKRTLSGPMYSLEASFKSHKVNYNNNPIMRWNLTNTTVDIDVNGNQQPHKGKNQRRRIDGVAALLDAYVMFEQKRAEYESVI